MRDCTLGVFAFILFAIYDWNSIGIRNRFLHKMFLFGCLFLLGTTGVQIWQGFHTVAIGVYQGAWLVGAVLFLGLLCYTLFFALPFEKTYGSLGGKPMIYDGGMYALCRHPGVIWFFCFYFCLGVAFLPTTLLVNGMVYSFCNLIYVVGQDRWTFPMLFDGYEKYQETTPFIIPNRGSMKRAWVKTYVK